jgi:hypothetical protein
MERPARVFPVKPADKTLNASLKDFIYGVR